MSLINPYRALLELLPTSPLQVATVAASDVASGTSTVTFPGGGTQRVRGSAPVGQQVFVRGGLIEGVAPALITVDIDV